MSFFPPSFFPPSYKLPVFKIRQNHFKEFSFVFRCCRSLSSQVLNRGLEQAGSQERRLGKTIDTLAKGGCGLTQSFRILIDNFSAVFLRAIARNDDVSGLGRFSSSLICVRHG